MTPASAARLDHVDIIITIAADAHTRAQYIKRGLRWYRRALPFKVPLIEEIEDSGTNWEPTNLETTIRELRKIEAYTE